ncbi:aldo/keto reductase [Anaerolentibacter hominis]|uniref:aldo/keto reductase n=1 Tax=Anaerolentibacter hominis TaxID=3079009 RepID=UPI0031B807C3
MRYRELGTSGLRLSEIGLGCEGFAGKEEEFTRELFDLAMEHGVNCMDLYSPDPELQSRIGRMIKGRRDTFILQAHLCTVWEDGQYRCSRDPDEVKNSFEEMLTRLDTEYVDIGMIHYVDSVKGWKELEEGEVVKYMLRLKEEGKIRLTGVSSHNPAAALRAVKSGLIDVLMFSVNPCYDLLPGDEDCEMLWAEKSYEQIHTNMDPERKELYETCQRMGVGITVMKAFGGGDLLSEYSPAGKALTVNQCIHYALTRPAAVSVMSGVRSLEDLKLSLAYEDATEEEKDYAAAFASFPKINWEGHCMYCGHCAPCPKGIDIASVTKFLNLAKAQGEVPETVREHYKVLEYTAKDCILCGACEKRCPFQVPVRENMREALQVFGK